MNLLMIYVWFGYKFKIFFLNLNLLIYFWLLWIFVAVHGRVGVTLVAMHWLLTVVASLDAEHGL